MARAELFEVVVKGPVGWVWSRRSASGWTSGGPALIPRTRRKSNRYRYGLRCANIEGQRGKADVQQEKERIARPKPRRRIGRRAQRHCATVRGDGMSTVLVHVGTRKKKRSQDGKANNERALLSRDGAGNVCYRGFYTLLSPLTLVIVGPTKLLRNGN